MRNVYIFGAHSRAQTLAVYLTGLDPDCKVVAYLVDNDEKNETEINSVPVIRLDEADELNTEYDVYLGIKGVYHESANETLKKFGFKRIIPVTVELDIKLRNDYLQKLSDKGEIYYKKLPQVESDKANLSTTDRNVCIYTVRSAFDKELKDNSYVYLPCEKGIQVGTALTDTRLDTCMFFDNEGDNISDRNRQFCESTAIYWMWKHAEEDIVGLVHYRRHFLLPENWLEIMDDEKIDVILPTPLYLVPNIADNYRFRHEPSNWDFMMSFLKSRDVGEYRLAEEYFAGNWFNPCNMFIMRREIFNEFCEWLFPILFAVAEHGGKMDDTYQNRYPAFMTERLLSWYFDMHKDKYNIVYADKNFME